MELKAAPDQIVLKRYEPPNKSEGGIALPQRMQKEPNSDKIGEVVEVGENVTLVRIGDRVAVNLAYAIAVNFGGQTGTLIFVKEENILAHIKD
jgi:co-chaperonin GroES (HSP10)